MPEGFVKKWPLEYQIVTKTNLLSYLCDSNDGSDSSDSSDGSESSDCSDSSESGESVTVVTKTTLIKQQKFHNFFFCHQT